MCLIVWNWQPNSPSPLLVIGNRDEFYARPTQSLHWWGDDILAGKDLKGGGTWMGVTKGGKFAALTNYRGSDQQRDEAPSRGKLVVDFLESSQSLEGYLEYLSLVEHSYNPFNLILYDGIKLKGFESRHNKTVNIEPGVGGLSNADFNSPWPKVEYLKNQLTSENYFDSDSDLKLLDLLQNARQAPDHLLPKTGVSLDRERVLSSCFVKSSDYGTRSSSIVRFTTKNISFTEQCYAVARSTTKTEIIFEI
jgi:uncharacterized protein with NRDE domain